jgi:CheY-like chemotaxis protein
MTMPHMTGAELAQTILGMRPDIPVILCTGQSELINRKKALALGVCVYLNKPVLQHDFLSAVRKALERDNPQHPAG